MWCAVSRTRHATAGISAHRRVPCTQIILEEAAYCDPGLVRSARCCLMAWVAAHPPRLRAQVAEVVVPLLRCYSAPCLQPFVQPTCANADLARLSCAQYAAVRPAVRAAIEPFAMPLAAIRTRFFLRIPISHTPAMPCRCISTILDSGNRALCLKSPLCRIAHGCHVCVAQTTAKWWFATTRTIFACVISALTLTFMQMEMQDDYGHPIFESIKITLVRSARAPTRHLPC